MRADQRRNWLFLDPSIRETGFAIFDPGVFEAERRIGLESLDRAGKAFIHGGIIRPRGKSDNERCSSLMRQVSELVETYRVSRSWVEVPTTGERYRGKERNRKHTDLMKLFRSIQACCCGVEIGGSEVASMPPPPPMGRGDQKLIRTDRVNLVWRGLGRKEITNHNLADAIWHGMLILRRERMDVRRSA